MSLVRLPIKQYQKPPIIFRLNMRERLQSTCIPYTYLCHLKIASLEIKLRYLVLVKSAWLKLYQADRGGLW